MYALRVLKAHGFPSAGFHSSTPLSSSSCMPPQPGGATPSKTTGPALTDYTKGLNV